MEGKASARAYAEQLAETHRRQGVEFRANVVEFEGGIVLELHTPDVLYINHIEYEKEKPA